MMTLNGPSKILDKDAATFPGYTGDSSYWYTSQLSIPKLCPAEVI